MMAANEATVKHQAKKLYDEDSFDNLFAYVWDEARKEERELVLYRIFSSLRKVVEHGDE